MHWRARFPLSAFDLVKTQLTTLIPRFGLAGCESRITAAYEMVCRESLSIPCGQRPPEFSRINEDGTPFQFCLTLKDGTPPLQFLTDVGVPGSSNSERMVLSLKALRQLAPLFSLEDRLAEVLTWLLDIVPPTDRDLLGDPAGVFWIGLSFAQAQASIKVYINGKWGNENQRWVRFDSFISHFSAAESWAEAAGFLRPSGMAPLGMAITLRCDRPITGRLYVSAYGKPLEYYENLFDRFSDLQWTELFRRYTEAVIAEDRCYPTQSVVCSLEYGIGRAPDLKFEMCGHCAFSSDADAAEKCGRATQLLGADKSFYAYLLEVLAGGQLLSRSRPPRLHSFVGFGVQQGRPYCTIYLKPLISGTETIHDPSDFKERGKGDYR